MCASLISEDRNLTWYGQPSLPLGILEEKRERWHKSSDECVCVGGGGGNRWIRDEGGMTSASASLTRPPRQPGQNTSDDLSSRDFREELEQNERELKDKKDRAPAPRSFTGIHGDLCK